MATDNLALLFRLKGDASGLTAASAQGRQAVAQLRQSLGPQLGQALSVTNRGFAEATNTLAVFAGQRLPLVGNAVISVTQSLQGLAAQTAVTGSTTAALAGPVAIAIAALAAQVAVVVTLTKVTFDLARASAEYQGKLFDLSQQVGVSVETLSALEIAARKTGGSIESVTSSLGIFQRKLEEAFEDEGSKAAVSLRKLGVDATNTEDALVQTVAALARMPEGFRQTAAALELFGRGGKAVLAIAKESKGDINALRESLRGLGGVTTEQARIADEFNDQLVDLQVAMRGLGTEAIPVVLDVLRDLSQTMKENRELFNVLQGIVKAVALSISVPLKAALNGLRIQFNNVEPILRVTVLLFERLAQAIGFIADHPVALPSAGEGATGQPPTGTIDQRDPFTESLKDEVEARKKLQAVLNVDFAERQRQAEASIALAQQEFEAGKRTREQLTQATIEGTRKQTQAEIDALNNDRKIKLQEQALAKDDIEKRQQLSNQILAIDAQVANKQATQRLREADVRARAQQEERQAQLANEQRLAEVEARAGEQRIAVLEQQIQQQFIAREEGLRQIEAIENTALQARGQLLKRELDLAGVGPDRQAVLDAIKALENDRTALERQQSERRKQLTREEFDSKRQLVLDGLNALLKVEQIQGEARIATIQAQAVLRIKTEEQAAREILAVKLRLLDAEAEAVRIRQSAAASITNPNERRQAQAQLAADLQVLNAQRVALQEQGNRDIDTARQRDLENERDYFIELRRIRERIVSLQRKTAEEVIRLMVLHGARRKDVIRAQRDLELQEEKDRHERELESIRAQQRETDSEIRLLELRLDSLRIGTTEEIEEHDRLIESLERLRAKRAELGALEEAEGGLSKAITKGINESANTAITDAGPVGGFNFGLQAGQLVDLAEGVTDFSDVAKAAFSAVGVAANQMANAVGNVVEAFVLYGSAGTSVRKVTAEILASIAKQASVKAIFEVAEGLAALALAFFGIPNAGPSASAHFAAAAAYGAIAGVAALAGRSVAGNLFQPQQGGSRAGSSGGRGTNERGESNPIDLTRQRQEQVLHIFVHSEPGPGFAQEVVRAVVHNVSVNGEMRDVMVKTAGG